VTRGTGDAFGMARAATDGACPCGGHPAPGTAYAACCGRLHDGGQVAETAEALMRSRYCAFAVGDEDYLLRTWHPKTRPASLQLDPRHAWVGLEVLGGDGRRRCGHGGGRWSTGPGRAVGTAAPTC
jgi:SEC-C motif-containing protein